MAARETAEQRRARIRAKLAQEQEATHPLFADAPTNEDASRARMQERDLAAQREYEANKSDATEPEKSTGRNLPKPSAGKIASRVIERRQSKPSNYKVHVVTALALTLTVRVLALGPKAAFGGK